MTDGDRAPAVPLSLLDRALTPAGVADAAVLARVVDRARTAEDLGFHGFWVAEHHAVPGIAGSSPALLAGAVAAATQRIRVGTGGLMVPPSRRSSWRSTSPSSPRSTRAASSSAWAPAPASPPPSVARCASPTTRPAATTTMSPHSSTHWAAAAPSPSARSRPHPFPSTCSPEGPGCRWRPGWALALSWAARPSTHRWTRPTGTTAEVPVTRSTPRWPGTGGTSAPRPTANGRG